MFPTLVMEGQARRPMAPRTSTFSRCTSIRTRRTGLLPGTLNGRQTRVPMHLSRPSRSVLVSVISQPSYSGFQQPSQGELNLPPFLQGEWSREALDAISDLEFRERNARQGLSMPIDPAQTVMGYPPPERWIGLEARTASELGDTTAIVPREGESRTEQKDDNAGQVPDTIWTNKSLKLWISDKCLVQLPATQSVTISVNSLGDDTLPGNSTMSMGMTLRCTGPKSKSLVYQFMLKEGESVTLMPPSIMDDGGAKNRSRMTDLAKQISSNANAKLLKTKPHQEVKILEQLVHETTDPPTLANVFSYTLPDKQVKVLFSARGAIEGMPFKAL
jgi:hypothetical protein